MNSALRGTQRATVILSGVNPSSALQR